MSHKGEDNDYQFKNNLIPNTNITSQSSSSFIPPPSAPASTYGGTKSTTSFQAIQQPLQQPPSTTPMPYFNDWMNFVAPSPFDIGYREEFNRSQIFNQQFPPPNLLSIGQQPVKPQLPDTKSANSAATATGTNSNAQQSNNPSAKLTAQQQQQQQQQQQFLPPPAFMPPMNPYIDPATAYMYSLMNPYGFPPFNPYLYNPYFMQRPPMDDQQSLHSYHFDFDNRSEKKLNMNMPLRAQSVVGNQGFKTEPMDHHHHLSQPQQNASNQMRANTGLLIEDHNHFNQHNLTMGVGDTSAMLNDANASVLTSTKKENELQHRLTPQMHQLPHVRASFSINGLVQIRANDPCEGQPALVDIFNLSEIMEQHLINLKKICSNEDEKSLRVTKSTTSSDIIGDDLLNNNQDEEDFSLLAEMSKETLMNYKLLQEFPGPLQKEHTSKAQLIQFCQKIVRDCLASNIASNLIDPQSHALLWDYLALLVRQNGIVDLKTDISPLLLSGIVDAQQQWSLTIATTTSLTASLQQHQQQDFVMINNDTASLDEQSKKLSQLQQHQQQNNQHQQTNEDEMHLNRLRQLLGAGQRSDAIEFSMKHNMWPHALFLASSGSSLSLQTSLTSSTALAISNSVSNLASFNNLAINESKTLNKVKTRFINSLQTNDPIQTCYQLLIGRVPSVSNNVSKSEWNDWRRHLAMIVANVDESNKDLVNTSIKTMGDSLALNGRVAASHFCYLLSDCQFGNYNKKSSKMVLIGSSHNQDFNKFCQISAIQATEIYEFARSLSPSNKQSAAKTTNDNQQQINNFLDHFVKYKLIYTMRLLEFGLVNEACKYVEILARTVNMNPKLHSDKISVIYQLANRLKVFDPDFSVDDSNTEPAWLLELANNYKKIHLNKLWYLLPIESAPNQPPPPQQQQQQLSTVPEFNSTDKNLIIQTKNEPKSGEPSPNHYQAQVNTENQFYNPQQQQQQQQQYNYDYQQQTQQLDNQMDQLKLNYDNQYNYQQQQQQALLSQPQQQPQSNQNQFQSQLSFIPVVDNFDQQSQQTLPIQQQQASQAPPPLFFNPANLQQTQNSTTNHLEDAQSSRKSSVSSSSNLPTSSFNNTSQQRQIFNYPQQPQQQQHQISSSNAFYNPNAMNENNSSRLNSRSRMSSTSTNDNIVNTINSQPSYHEASITKSSTFPPNRNSSNVNEADDDEDDEDDLGTHNNKKNSLKSKANEDNFKADNSKENAQAQQQQNNSSFWSRTLGRLIPANTANKPKAMVLPDDRKKTIVWDEKLGRYVNTDGGTDAQNEIKPPPIPTFQPQPSQNNPHASSSDKPSGQPTMPAASGGPNLYSIRNSNKRNYYSRIDVMGDSVKKINDQQQQAIAPLLSNVEPPSQIPPKFFVPQQQHQQPSAPSANPTVYQSADQSNNNYQQYQQQQQHQQQPTLLNVNSYQKPYYQPANEYYRGGEESDSATNSGESYNGGGGGTGTIGQSSHNSSSNESSSNGTNTTTNQQYQQQYYYQQQQQHQQQYNQQYNQQPQDIYSQDQDPYHQQQQQQQYYQPNSNI